MNSEGVFSGRLPSFGFSKMNIETFIEKLLIIRRPNSLNPLRSEISYSVVRPCHFGDSDRRLMLWECVMTSI
nr:MAG TPA: hypothetical protein [Caudoviricetes sp.]